MVPLRIPASSAPGFHWVLGLLLLFRKLKRWYMIIGKVADRGDCEAREYGIRKARWEPLVVLVVSY